MSSDTPRLIYPGDPLHGAISAINRRFEAAMRPHRGKPEVEAAFARHEARCREVEAQVRQASASQARGVAVGGEAAK
jgi:hypothetical protein